MKPIVTFLTSSELQDALGNPLSDEEEEELQRFRDRVMESFGNLDEALEEMEDLYGRGWKTFDTSIWVFEGNTDSVSSPILLKRKSVEVTVFEAFWLLARLFIRDDPPDAELVEPGYGKIDAVSALLAKTALERVMEEDGYAEVEEAARSDTDDRRVLEENDGSNDLPEEGRDIKTWRKVDELAEQWDPDEKPLYDWLEAR